MEQTLLETYIALKKRYGEQDGSADSVLALYRFKDELEQRDDAEANTVLVDLCWLLGLMKSACDLLETFADKTDRKQLKKLVQLQGLRESHGDRYALPRPKTEAERAARREKLRQYPAFRYHPDPFETGTFEEGEESICPCCGKATTVTYAMRPYCIDNVDGLCPDCIASGRAAERYDAQFAQDAEWEGEPDPEKNAELFRRTPGYISWQGEHWLSCCGDYCAYLGTVGTRELKAMDIAEEVLAEYETRGGYADVADYLVKDGSLCGYLFRCLHCGRHHLWVDAD